MTFISSSTAPGPALGYHRHALYAWEPPSPRVRCRQAFFTLYLLSKGRGRRETTKATQKGNEVVTLSTSTGLPAPTPQLVCLGVRRNGKPRSRLPFQELTKPEGPKNRIIRPFDGVGPASLASINQSPSPFAAPVLHDRGYTGTYHANRAGHASATVHTPARRGGCTVRTSVSVGTTGLARGRIR